MRKQIKHPLGDYIMLEVGVSFVVYHIYHDTNSYIWLWSWILITLTMFIFIVTHYIDEFTK